MKVEGAAGKPNGWNITDDNRGDVTSKANSRSYYISRDLGQLFALSSHDPGAVAADYICYWKNTSTTQDLHIDVIRVGAVEAVLWKVWLVTGTGTGSTITPVNLNTNFSHIAEATALGNAAVGGLSTAGQVSNIRTGALGHEDINFADTLILGQNAAIAVEYDTGTGGIAEVLIRGFYE